MAEKKSPRSGKEIEADIKLTRDRLASNVDELASRASPAELKRRAVASLKLKANDATRTPDGKLRMDRFAVVLGSVAGLTLTLGAARRAFHN